jgi:(1->4)-alpha-D-glucan 1-alpha-D-glucosylmutase
MDRIYRNFVDDEIDLDELAYRCRKLIIRVALASELNVLASQLTRIALSKRRSCDFTLNSLRDALTEVVASFPVYRTYVTPSEVSNKDVSYIRSAVASAKSKSPATDTSVFDFVGEVLLTRIAEGQDPAYRNAVTTLAMKVQQFTSPVMAKGLEDTAFYRYNRLVSLNDVGSDLHRFGTATAEFHAANQERLRNWPHTMLATSTHDSKRSEDVRARINALSEIPDLWRLRVREWRRFNRGHKSRINSRPVPSPNDEYLLYQTLLGAWPAQPLNDTGWKNFCERIENYVLKAIREAKENTSWINRNTAYENAVSSFVTALLKPGPQNRFLNDFLPFQRRIARIGMWNSLAQTVLKLTSPGVPDIYQGNELWDLSLVDPDNRRPVDYILRQEMLRSIRQGTNDLANSLMERPEDDRSKLYLTWRTLCLRQEQPDLFQEGEYLPLLVEGAKANHVVAFVRKSAKSNVLVAVPRLVAGLLNNNDVPPIGSRIWEDTQVLLPFCTCSEKYRSVFTGEVVETEKIDGSEKIAVSKILAEFPVAVCLLDSPE